MISQTAEYALRAVVCLARAERRLNVHEIAETTLVPEGYLAKVMQSLVRANVVVSQRGRRGGFDLARPHREISVLEVINAVDPIRRITKCPLDLPEHEEELCALHRRVDDSIAKMEEAFGSTSLANLLEDPGPHWPLGAPEQTATQDDASNAVIDVPGPEAGNAVSE